MASSLLKDYIGRGLAAARPATPDTGTGVAAVYFATDTEVYSVWNGSAWVELISNAPAWGAITGTLADQTDLQTALNAKLDDSQATAFGLSLLDDADAAAARTTLGLGTAATSASTAFFAASGVSAFGATLVDDADAAAARTTLGLGTAATAASTAFSTAWTYATLASDFDTSSTTAADITGLSFTPAANTKYEFEIMLLLRTAAGTTGPQPGLAWPTGLTDGVVRLFASASANGEIIRHGNPSAAVLVANTGMSSTTTSFMGGGNGFIMAGATPSGDVKVQLASEVGASVVTAKAGSFLRWRVIA